MRTRSAPITLVWGGVRPQAHWLRSSDPPRRFSGGAVCISLAIVGLLSLGGLLCFGQWSGDPLSLQLGSVSVAWAPRVRNESSVSLIFSVTRQPGRPPPGASDLRPAVAPGLLGYLASRPKVTLPLAPTSTPPSPDFRRSPSVRWHVPPLTLPLSIPLSVPDVPPRPQPLPATPPEYSEEAKRRANERIKQEARAQSAAALSAMRDRILHVPIRPAWGPAHSIHLPPADADAAAALKYHVVVTSDATTHSKWQALVSYHSFQKVRDSDARGAMGGYTRLLHSTQPDDIMHLVPTIIVDPLPYYVVHGSAPLNRPWALTQFLARVRIDEDYILLAEPDHVFFRQPPLLASPTDLAVWPFGYVDCSSADVALSCIKAAFNPRSAPSRDIARAGHAPVIVYKATLAEIVPVWDKLVRTVHADEHEDSALLAVQEMYAFGLAVSTVSASGTPAGIKYHAELMVDAALASSLRVDTCQGRMPQPDECAGGVSSNATWRDASIIHSSLSQHLDERGRFLWNKVAAIPWDKRAGDEYFPSVPITLPPEETSQPMIELVRLVNEAAAGSLLWRAYSEEPEQPERGLPDVLQND